MFWISIKQVNTFKRRSLEFRSLSFSQWCRRRHFNETLSLFIPCQKNSINNKIKYIKVDILRPPHTLMKRTSSKFLQDFHTDDESINDLPQWISITLLHNTIVLGLLSYINSPFLRSILIINPVTHWEFNFLTNSKTDTFFWKLTTMILCFVLWCPASSQFRKFLFTRYILFFCVSTILSRF